MIWDDHTGDLMFNGIHDRHRLLNRRLCTAAVPPPRYNILYLHDNIAFYKSTAVH